MLSDAQWAKNGKNSIINDVFGNVYAIISQRPKFFKKVYNFGL